MKKSKARRRRTAEQPPKLDLTGFDTSYRSVLTDQIARLGLRGKALTRVTARATTQLEPVATQLARSLLEALRSQMPRRLRDHRRDHSGFVRRHATLWKAGFDLFEATLAICAELGDAFNAQYRARAAQDQDYLFDVLTRLQARAVHVAHEVLALLKEGFADGAHARWRTLHEIAVTAYFINSRGAELAKRYVEHQFIESYKAALQFQEHAPRLNHRKISRRELSRLKTFRDALCEDYGKPYGTTYGWAAAALAKERPTFDDIEGQTDLRHWRPYYRLASHNIHANPKGLFNQLGIPRGTSVLLVGPSNYGLTDPAQGAIHALVVVTTMLLVYRPGLDSVVYAKILQELDVQTANAFWRVQRRMERKRAR